MDLTRLAEKRTKRNRAWASVCISLFGGDADESRQSRESRASGATTADVDADPR